VEGKAEVLTTDLHSALQFLKGEERGGGGRVIPDLRSAGHVQQVSLFSYFWSIVFIHSIIIIRHGRFVQKNYTKQVNPNCENSNPLETAINFLFSF
jgi:hypothetical protein